MIWTAEAQAVLEARAAEGKSFQDVAEELGTTRCAVSGRAMRTHIRFHGRVDNQAKLTPEAVRELRRGRSGQISALARKHGVHPRTAYRARAGLTWTDVQ